jgi:nuclear-control-of-ATPase protein 2
VLYKFGRPSLLTRYWLPILTIGYASYTMMTTFFIKRQTFFDMMLDFFYTAQRFLKYWIVKPLQGVYKTIRYDEDRLSTMNTESVYADLEVRESFIL